MTNPFCYAELPPEDWAAFQAEYDEWLGLVSDPRGGGQVVNPALSEEQITTRRAAAAFWGSAVGVLMLVGRDDAAVAAARLAARAARGL